MYDLRMQWMPGELLEKPEDGIVDETHRVVKNENDMGGGEKTVTYQQETYEENPLSDFVRMGFTVEEVEAALAE